MFQKVATWLAVLLKTKTEQAGEEMEMERGPYFLLWSAEALTRKGTHLFERSLDCAFIHRFLLLSLPHNLLLPRLLEDPKQIAKISLISSSVFLLIDHQMTSE